MPPDETANGQSSASIQLPEKMPERQTDRAALFQQFVDDADARDGSNGERRRERGDETRGDEEQKPRLQKKAKTTNGHAEEDPADDTDEPDAGDDTADTDADEAVDDQSSDAEDDGEADDAGSEEGFRTFEEIAEAAGLEAEQLRELKFEVRIDGKPREVTYAELVKGYRRQSDLTKGFQEVAEAKRTTATLHQQVADALEARVNESAAYIRAIHRHMTIAEEAIAKLSDPKSKLFATERNTQAKKIFDDAVKAVTEVDEARKAAAKAAKDARVAYEYDTFVSRNPAYKDPAKLEKMGDELGQFLKERGFSSEDIEDLSDHRWIEMALEMMRQKKTVTTKKAITAKTVRKLATKSLKGRSAPDKGNASQERIRRAAADIGRRPGAMGDWLKLSGRL